MTRPMRAFRPWSSELEGRLLLTTRPGALRPFPRGDSVYFAGPTMTGAPELAMQREGSATVYLATNYAPRAKPLPPFQVLVETDPSSPALGVNVGAVHQIITIGGGNSDTSVTIPIIAGAPNPGEVDVTLTITPVNSPPNFKVGPPLHLKVLASEDFLPPLMGTTRVTAKGIEVTFSKPMDPAGASDVNNYAVKVMGTSSGPAGLGSAYSPMNFITSIPPLFGNGSSTPAPTVVRLKSAQYDPETLTVTLIPQRNRHYRADMISVSERQPNAPGGRRHGSDHGPLLTDLRGQRLGNMMPAQYLDAPTTNPPA